MSCSYVVLTNKPGIFRTEPGLHLVPVETWEIQAAGQVRVRFVIARLDQESHVSVQEETTPHQHNRIRTKFLHHHPDLESARGDIEQLARGLSPGERLIQMDH